MSEASLYSSRDRKKKLTLLSFWREKVYTARIQKEHAIQLKLEKKVSTFYIYTFYFWT